jgi:hypothetical protein
VSKDNAEKTLIHMLAIAVATFFERAVTELLERAIEWARAQKKRD